MAAKTVVVVGRRRSSRRRVVESQFQIVVSVVEATRVDTEIALESSRRKHNENRQSVETYPSRTCLSCRRVRHGSTTRSSSGSSSGVGDLAVSLMRYGIRAKGCRRIRSFLLGARSGDFSFGTVTICPCGSFGVGTLKKGSSRGGTSFNPRTRLRFWLEVFTAGGVVR